MRLYTESEIRKFFTDEYEEELSIDELIERLTPIEIPSDEGIYEQAKEMEKEEKLRLIKFTSEIFELGKSHFSYALITNEEILELYNETNETNNERNSE